MLTRLRGFGSIQKFKSNIYVTFTKSTNITNAISTICTSYKARCSSLLAEYRNVDYPSRTNEAQEIPLMRLLDLVDTSQNRLGYSLSSTVEINVLIAYSITELWII